MRREVFRGAATALITPLNAGGVDFKKLEKLIEWQIGEGINGLVICGTTGEGSTLSDAEHREVLKKAVDVAAGRTVMIAGTGSNDTAYGKDLTKCACDLGYDAMLVVTPYYNKATQNGLIKMYNTIADASTKPVILYNVPSRTGVNIDPATYAELAKHPNIAGTKEANGDIAKIVETRSLVGDDFAIWSGNDDQITPILACGGSGVISVLSNLFPKKTMEICEKYFAGDITGSMALQCQMFKLIKALFCEVNPIPVKAAMAAMGFCEDYLRLPLTPMEEAHKSFLYECMRQQGINI